MQALLEHEDLWACIEGTETDAKNIAKARSEIILSITSTFKNAKKC